jgi:hypothetical protein
MIQFKDGSLGWLKLKDLKESNPIEVAQYVVVNQFVEEPAFKQVVGAPSSTVTESYHIQDQVKVLEDDT